MTKEFNKFNAAFNTLLLHEGGYSNDQGDPGGETNMGITQNELSQVYQRLNIHEKVRDLTVNDAKIYYKSEWWDKYHYDSIKSSYISTKILDMAVNMGAHEAHMLIQRALNSIGYNLTVDGILGTRTIKAINECSLYGRESLLTTDIKNQASSFYTNLVKQKPSLIKFIKGWLKRAKD